MSPALQTSTRGLVSFRDVLGNSWPRPDLADALAHRRSAARERLPLPSPHRYTRPARCLSHWGSRAFYGIFAAGDEIVMRLRGNRVRTLWRLTIPIDASDGRLRPRPVVGDSPPPHTLTTVTRTQKGRKGHTPPISCRSCGPAILPRGLIHVYVDSCSRSNVRPATPIQPHPIRNDNTFPFNSHQLFLSLVPPTDKTPDRLDTSSIDLVYGFTASFHVRNG